MFPDLELKKYDLLWCTTDTSFLFTVFVGDALSQMAGFVYLGHSS